MSILKSIRAWLAGLFTKGKTMTDTVNTTVDTSTQSTAVLTATPAAVVPAVPAAVVSEAPAPDLIEKLEAILAALGHELPMFWDEAVALAKKAL